MSGNTAYSSGSGGAIFSPNTLVSNSTLSSNTAGDDGGAICTSGTLTVNNGTLSNNTTNDNGGAISIEGSGTLVLSNSTLSGNLASKGGGIYHDSSNTSQIANSLVTGNTAINGKEIYIYPTSLGTTQSLGYNLFGQNGVSGVTGATLDPSDIVPSAGVTIDQIIGPLANNGGPTPGQSRYEGG